MISNQVNLDSNTICVIRHCQIFGKLILRKGNDGLARECRVPDCDKVTEMLVVNDRKTLSIPCCIKHFDDSSILLVTRKHSAIEDSYRLL